MAAAMDRGTEGGGARVVGEYVLGPRIGSGSFAVVYRATHRTLAVEVAVKEIDRKQLSRKVSDSLVKEIAILKQIDHPNIIRFHQSIETADKIYLVLEYCVGGDLAGYIQRYGRVSQAVARHFMRQLASGLQVLRENNLIHRDLKPQNLLLSTCDETPVLKIGDFGFARYLTPQGLADTLCGSPLYMAPEIIQNQKYDAKADLWSVGAILFQLVTGKPPFDGNSQFQLFQNILTSTGLKFPESILEELHPDCVDLCRSLLRQNPVERLTFEEFFNHRFMLADEVPYSLPSSSQSEDLPDEQLPFALEASRHPVAEVPFPTLDTVSQLEPCCRTEKNIFIQKHESQTKDSCTKGKSTEQRKLIGDSDASSSSGKASVVTAVLDTRSSEMVSDSLELIEREYVVVNAQFLSMETLSSSLEKSVIGSSAGQLGGLNKKQDSAATLMHNLEPPSFFDFRVLRSHESVPLEKTSQMSSEQKEMLRKSSLHPSVRFHLLHQYIEALTDLAQDKLQRGMHLDSFSVKLVVLATWKEALRLCHSWMDSIRESGSTDTNKDSFDQQNNESIPDVVESVNFDSPISACSRAQRGFLSAFDQAEKISNYIRPIDGAVEMPDAMDIIFQTALLAGKSGAVDELMRNKKNAACLYTKATTLLSFILEEAPYLSLTPPFSLSVTDRQRVHRYILALRAHQNRSELAETSSASNATMLSSQNENI